MTAESQASCPRCGYDLVGQVATWRESCPMEGVCPECGLAFSWRFVLNPNQRVPGWSFEHASKWSVRRLVGTWARLFRPVRFWDRFPIEAPVRHSRLIGYGLSCIGMSIGLLAARLSGWAAFEYSIDPMATPRSASGLADTIWNSWHDHWPELLTTPILGLVWTMALTFPLLVAVLLPMTFAMASVRKSQILRCGAYSLTIPAAGVVGVLTLELLDVALGMPLEWYWASHRILYPIGHMLALGWWWHAALTRYLRLPGAGKILFWHGMASGLTGLAVATRLLGLSL